MDRRMVRMLLKLLCIALAAQYINGASKCPRINTDPKQHCKDECTLLTGCRGKKKCLCDGDCGYSCVHTNKRCSKPKTVRNGQVLYKRYRFNDTQRVVCKSGFKLAGSVVRTCRGIGYWDGKQARCRRPQKSCNDPGTQGLLLRNTPANKAGKFKAGTKLSYYCPQKFTLKGANPLICKKDGSWSASLPQCIVPKCNPAVLPAHTQVIRPRNWRKRRDYGVQLPLSCDYGYTSTQRGTYVCDPPGWKLQPTSFKCFPKSCPNPGRPRNGNVKGLFVFGQRVTYTCDKCYKLNGVSYRTCQADQRWTDTQPTCDPVTCSMLKNPAHGYLTSNSQQCDSIVQYYCDAGYTLIGSSRRRCQSDGTWTGKEPKCETTQCPDPGTPLNGKKKGLFFAGQTITFSCDPCYKLSGRSTRTCQSDRTWSGRQPTCQMITCNYLPDPNNGKRTNRYRYSNNCGAQRTFVCNKGYNLKGANKRTCQTDGRWSGFRTICVKAAVKTTPKAKTRAVTTAATSSMTSSSFSGSGMPLSTTFIPTAPSTVAALTLAINSACGPFKQLPHGARVRFQSKDGNSLLIACKPGFSLLSSGILKCNTQTLKWKISRNVSCVAKSCSDPGIPRNGKKHGVSYFVGDKVKYSCNPCYRLEGVAEITCLNNESWSNKPPNCVVKTCSTPLGTPQATVSYISLECDEKATYTCRDPKLTMLGSGEKLCNTSSVWQGKEPKCIDPNVDVNIALNKPASMSSHWKIHGGDASVAVDGNRKGGFFHTDYEYGSWWRVDLGKEEPVSTVIVVNRRDCCINRINGFKVSVGNKPKEGGLNRLCGTKTVATSAENFIHCPQTLRGRYVFVYMSKRKYTTMALIEVEVYRKKMVQ